MTNTPEAKTDAAENKCGLTENPVQTDQCHVLSSVLMQGAMLHKISRGQTPTIILSMQNVPAKFERSGRVMTCDGATSPHTW